MTESGGLRPEILLVDDEKAMRKSSRQWLELAGYQVRDFDRAPKALEGLTADFSGVILSDVKMPGMDGIAFQQKAAAIDPEIPVILITGHGDIAMAVEAMQAGAYDFIEKPFDPDRILDLVRRAIEQRRLVLENRQLKGDLATASGLDARLVGTSDAIRWIKREIASVATTDASVLLIGETGTGKEVVAKCLHDLSQRREGPFLAVNCAAIHDQIAESELFGHEAGAFTGARRGRIGKLEAAKGGTLFLDEVSSMPMGIQGKMLRALQEREVVRLGANQPRPVDFRLVSAMNADPGEAMLEGRLREDLYYRLNIVEIVIPPLRERKEDILLLFSLFLERAADTYGREPGPLTAEGRIALMGHNWPGNVRELKNLAERYVLWGSAAPERLPELLALPGVEGKLGQIPLSEQVQLFERHLINDAIKRHQGNIKAVTEELGVPRRTLNEKMAKYGLKRSDGLDL